MLQRHLSRRALCRVDDKEMLQKINTSLRAYLPGQLQQLLPQSAHVDVSFILTRSGVDVSADLQTLRKPKLVFVLRILGQTDGAHESDDLRQTPRRAMVLDDFVPRAEERA